MELQAIYATSVPRLGFNPTIQNAFRFIVYLVRDAEEAVIGVRPQLREEYFFADSMTCTAFDRSLKIESSSWEWSRVLPRLGFLAEGVRGGPRMRRSQC